VTVDQQIGIHRMTPFITGRLLHRPGRHHHPDVGPVSGNAELTRMAPDIWAASAAQ